MSQVVNETSVDVNYTYNNRGDISTITNSNVTYTYAYTSFGDLKSISVGDTALVTYTYISNKNRTVSKVTYANGQTVNYTYTDDVLTKIVNKDSNNTVTNTITYDNDETGAVLKTKDSENGTVTKTVNDETQVWNINETSLLYSYLLTENEFIENVNGLEYITSYSLTDNTDEETNLYTTETTTFGETTKTVYLDAFERVVKEETKNGTTVVLLKEYEYNSNGEYTTDQIKSVTTTVGASDPETISYSYDKNGNILSTTNYPSHRYKYDEFNQVIYEYDGSQWLEYTYDYDNGGNLTSATGKSYVYGDDNWPDKLTEFNGQTITYDENGNPTSYLGATLTWKNGRQLASYSKGNTTVTYKYNSDGLRTEKNVNGTVYKYYWAEGLLSHQTWGSQSLHFYYDYNDEIIGFTYVSGSLSEDYIYIKNQQGDVIGIVDSNGTQVANYSYDALGWCTQFYGVYNSIVDINPIRYRGYYLDEELDMYYLQSRYYDYNTGRFINSDDPNLIEKLSKNDMHGVNVFAYCGNNAINYTDPSGYCYYNQNLKWCHDNWEYIGNYKRKKAPSIYNYLYPGYYKINISNGGGIWFKGKAFLKDYGNNTVYVKKVYFLKPDQLSAFIAVLKAKKTIKKILEKADSMIYDELFDYFKKELGKIALKSMKKYLQIFDYEWAQIIEDMLAFRANINALKKYKKKGKSVMFTEGTYDESNPTNPPTLSGTTTFIIEPWSGKVTNNPTSSNFYLLYKV